MALSEGSALERVEREQRAVVSERNILADPCWTS